ncbi:hypothetical protein HAX54_026107 [Datura stramonium]|uniref:Uncharacterized protein n=1 Tax=Datura stramonium TaxID=4076 RepID=A0ABS8V3D0_DATST|nr:hypothetical protein [Datura stramonium]
MGWKEWRSIMLLSRRSDPSMPKPSVKWILSKMYSQISTTRLGTTMAPKAQGPYTNITVTTIGIGAWARGAYNSRDN